MAAGAVTRPDLPARQDETGRGGVNTQAIQPEDIMHKTRLLAAVILLSTTIGAASVAEAIETSNPAPPSQPPSGQQSQPGTQKSHTKKPKRKNQTGSIEQFYNGYHKAYALIYTDKDYAGGIAVLRTLGYDDNPDVATLIGYASRKLGRYDDAKYWYDKALAADPNHALTWSYYGMWQAEQGNMLKAKDDLEKVRTICGNTNCPEYTALKAVIDGTVTY
jgi:tetratricopeptide (TPR) repeat protein